MLDVEGLLDEGGGIPLAARRREVVTAVDVDAAVQLMRGSQPSGCRVAAEQYSSGSTGGEGRPPA